jgi:hypothetical protein
MFEIDTAFTEAVTCLLKNRTDNGRGSPIKESFDTNVFKRGLDI